MRCAKSHKSTECPEKERIPVGSPKCTYCNGDHVAASREYPKFKEQFKKQTEKLKSAEKAPKQSR